MVSDRAFFATFSCPHKESSAAKVLGYSPGYFRRCLDHSFICKTRVILIGDNHAIQ